MRIIMAAAALGTAAIAAGWTALVPADAAVQSRSDAAKSWTIGPVIKGRNYSQGMPLHPAMTRSGPAFDFPYPSARAGHVHYVTRQPGSLAGARQISLRYRIDAAPGTRFVPQEYPDRPAILSLYLQRSGDNWLARGDYQYYRWYSPEARVVDLTPGVHELTIGLNEDWISVYGKTSTDQPRAFRDALAQADQIGFVMGSSGGRGHGVFATAPARFTILDFTIR